LFGIYIEEAKISERTVIEVLTNVSRYFSSHKSRPRYECRNRSRGRSVGPSGVLSNRTRPAGNGSCRLREKGAQTKLQAPELEDRSANIDRVHLLIFPCPDESVTNDIAHIWLNWHRF